MGVARHSISIATRQNVLVLGRPERDAVALVERELPPVGPSDALLRMLCAGICGTDLHILNWNEWAARSYAPPFALGHELCAEVIACGEAVTDFCPGDRVTAETHLSCGRCEQCLKNRRHTCLNLQVMSRLNRGAFADYTVLPAALLRHVPDSVPDDVATLFEPLGIAVRAVSGSHVRGKKLLVVGCGPIGLLTVAAARHYGASSITACDRTAERLALAGTMGADITINVVEKPLSASPEKYDVVVDASGSVPGIRDALSCTAAGGGLTLTGLPDAVVPLDLARHVILREVSINGIYGRLIDETWLMAERLMMDGSVDLSPLITHEFALTQFAAAFACARSGKAGKVIFRIAQS